MNSRATNAAPGLPTRNIWYVTKSHLWSPERRELWKVIPNRNVWQYLICIRKVFVFVKPVANWSNILFFQEVGIYLLSAPLKLWRRGGLVVSASYFQPEGRWFEPGRCRCVVSLNFTLPCLTPPRGINGTGDITR